VLPSWRSPHDDDREPAESDLERAMARLQLLADAGTLLAGALEVEPALASFARLTVKWFAQVSLVEVIDARAVVAWALAACDPELEDATRRAALPCQEPDARRSESARRVLETGRAELWRDVDDGALHAMAGNDDHLDAIRRLHLHSVIRAPLVARGRVVGLVTLGRTRGRPYDEDDLALAAELGRRAALAVDNARLFKRATDAVAVRDEFLAIASHELNTPLTPLKLQLDTLARGNFSPERTREKLDSACRQVTRLARLVEALLDMSRISERGINLRLETFDLAALADEVVERMADEARRAGSTVRVIAQRPCPGRWDRQRIDQVLSNLLSNALKYGGGRPVDIDITCTEKTARFVVRDQGIGISPEYHQRIFHRFERAAPARHYGGFGLGLWIAWRIVDASGGTISVESEPQKGAAFAVELPRDSAAGGLTVPGTRQG
jgi:signal transduction histidine kinase